MLPIVLEESLNIPFEAIKTEKDLLEVQEVLTKEIKKKYPSLEELKLSAPDNEKIDDLKHVIVNISFGSMEDCEKFWKLKSSNFAQ